MGVWIMTARFMRIIKTKTRRIEIEMTQVEAIQKARRTITVKNRIATYHYSLGAEWQMPIKPNMSDALAQKQLRVSFALEELGFHPMDAMKASRGLGSLRELVTKACMGRKE